MNRILHKIILFCGITLVSVNAVEGQSLISGVVKNADGCGMDFVCVTASPSNAPKNISASAFTDENGKFRLAVNDD